MKNRPVMMADIAAEWKEEQDWLEGYMDASILYQKAYNARNALRLIVGLMRLNKNVYGENIVQMDLSREFELLWQLYKDNQGKATVMFKTLIQSV